MFVVGHANGENIEMGHIILNAIDRIKNRITYHFSVSEDVKKYFSGKDFWIEYEINIESVPNSIAAIPFATALLPIMWLTDSTMDIPELDSEFYNCIPKIKEGYIDMYPGVEFKGVLQVQRIEETERNRKVYYQSACFYSGGVDATTSVFRHIDEKPLLISLWGSDVPSDNKREWELVYDTLSKSARNYSLDLSRVHTDFRDFDREDMLDSEFREALGKGWWYGVKHGIGIIGHAAPLVWNYGIENLYIASSNCPEDGRKEKCASDPRIDNQVRFCGCQVYHDGFELNRQKKIRYIVDYARSYPGLQIPLHVCWIAHTGGNCCHCEKCYRTMAELWIEGEDPRKYGFDYPDSVFRDMYKFIALKCTDMAKNTWTYGKERLIENWPNIKKTDYGKKIAWIKRFDFHYLDKNWDRKAYIVYRKIKHSLRTKGTRRER